jgi:hypothetical protein
MFTSPAFCSEEKTLEVARKLGKVGLQNYLM